MWCGHEEGEGGGGVGDWRRDLIIWSRISRGRLRRVEEDIVCFDFGFGDVLMLM
jgi:hypothetical protein